MSVLRDKEALFSVMCRAELADYKMLIKTLITGNLQLHVLQLEMKVSDIKHASKTTVV